MPNATIRCEPQYHILTWELCKKWVFGITTPCISWREQEITYCVCLRSHSCFGDLQRHAGICITKRSHLCCDICNTGDNRLEGLCPLAYGWNTKLALRGHLRVHKQWGYEIKRWLRQVLPFQSRQTINCPLRVGASKPGICKSLHGAALGLTQLPSWLIQLFCQASNFLQ